MNPEQVKSLIGYSAAVLSGIAVTLGVADQAAATQFTAQATVLVNAALTVVGAIGAIWTVVQGVWRRTHANQAQAVAQAVITTNGNDPMVIRPLIAALQSTGNLPTGNLR